ncbi:MAG: NAD(P)H-binding protein [Phaeodactylibacter sp.]|nr:NAD(P)H-binding protein [Phaeodactylibacter sp.]MCB9050761.1 NAD(P)H-binding protein [Lewinellaceae bacterium]
MEISQHHKTALLFGASGLVGNQCLHQLLEHPAYHKVISFGRRKLDVEHPQLEQHVIDFSRLEEYAPLLKGHDLYSCLGTTMARAGSREAFFKVDYTYAFESARLAAANGVNQLLLVSAVGADPDALFFYSRVKGELESAVKKLPFWAIHLFQPSVLLGDRRESRLAEQLGGRLALGLDRLTGGELLGKYRPVEAAQVARAMIHVAQRLEGGLFVYPSDEILALAGQDNKDISIT